MLRTRPRALAVGVLALSLSVLTACGSDDGSKEQAASALDSVTIKGEPGEAPEVTFDGKLEAPDKLVVKVLNEGDGETVADGDTVSLQFWVGNGFTQKEATSTFGQPPMPVELTDEVLEPLREATIDHQVGDRVAVLASAEQAFGEGGNPTIGIGNKDTVLFVIDIMDRSDTVPILDGPQGEIGRASCRERV